MTVRGPTARRLFAAVIGSLVVIAPASLAVAASSATSSTASPEGEDDRCISVTRNTYSGSGTDLGVATVQWEAELTNRCTMPYDADLQIRFVDEGGDVIYQSSDLLMVPRQASTVARREFNLPAGDMERVAEVVVDIVAERERPF